MEKIILFQIEDSREIERLAANMGIRVIHAGPETYQEILENIAMERVSPPTAPYQGGPLPGSLMVFCDVSEKHFNRLLFELRSRKAAVDLKAVMTPTNRKWTVLQLYRELERERAALL